MHLESRPETMNQACLPDVPGQGIPLGRGTSGNVPEGSLAMLLCFTVPGPHEHREITCSPSTENRGGMSSDKVAVFQGQNNA